MNARTLLGLAAAVVVVALWLALRPPTAHHATPRGDARPATSAAKQAETRPETAPETTPETPPEKIPAPPAGGHAAGDGDQDDALTADDAAGDKGAGQPVQPQPAQPSEPQPDAADGGPSEAPEPMIWSLDREGVVGAMGEIKPLIQDCYAGWRRSAGGDLQGRVAVQFTITAQPDQGPDEATTARIKAATLVDNTLEHAALEGCILNSVEGIKFEPPTDGDLEVTYPFLLTPDEDPQ